MAPHPFAPAPPAEATLPAAVAAVLHSNRAAAYQALSQAAQAVADCCRATALAPTYARARSRMAALLAAMSRHEDAARELRAALEVRSGWRGGLLPGGLHAPLCCVRLWCLPCLLILRRPKLRAAATPRASLLHPRAPLSTLPPLPPCPALQGPDLSADDRKRYQKRLSEAEAAASKRRLLPNEVGGCGGFGKGNFR